MGKLLNIAVSFFLLTVVYSPAHAGSLLLDPSTLFIGSGQGTPCATGGCPLVGNELNGFGPTTLDIYQNQGGAGDLYNPILLILGVPNNSAVPTVTGAQLYDPGTSSTPSITTTISTQAGTTHTFADFTLNIPASGFPTLMGPGVGDVYNFIGISENTNSSNSYTNWAGADQSALGVTASNFGIYVFELNLSSLDFSAKDLINVNVDNVAKGTFAVAYGQDGTHFYDTPFTEAGLQTHQIHHQQLLVPEPSTIALFGAGLIGVAFSLRRRNRRPMRQTAS